MRKRMILYAFLVSLTAHAVIGWNAVHNVQASHRHLTHQTYQEIMNQTSHNLITYFQDLEALASLLRTPEITHYARLYLPMHGDAKVQEEGNQVNKLLNRLSLHPAWVEKIYILGRNQNQANFGKVIGEAGWSSGGLPSIDDLAEFGLLDILLQGDGIPTHHSRQALHDALGSTSKSVLDIPQLVRDVHLINEIEDRLTIAVYEGDALVLIVLPKPFMQTFLNDALAVSGVEMRLYNTEPVAIWTSAPDTPETRAENMAFRMSRQLSPYHLNLELYHDGAGKFGERLPAKGLIAFLLLSVCASLLIACVFSWWIFLPIRRFALAIKKDARTQFPKQPIALAKTNRFIRNMSLPRKILYYFICSIMLPVVVSGLFVSYASYQMNKQRLIDAEALITQQLSKNVELHKRSFENLSHQLMLQETELSSRWVSVHPKMNDVNYYVIYDHTGSIRFSSIYGNNPELFPIDPSILTKPFRQDLWMPLAEDVFNHHSSSLTSKIMKDGQVAGYIDLKINLSGLTTINDDSLPSELLLIDSGNQVFYQSHPDRLPFRTAAAARHLQQDHAIVHVDKQDYVRIAKPVLDSEWTVLHYVPLAAIIADSQLWLMKHIYFPFLILVVAFVLSYAMSRSLTKPLLSLHKAMRSAEGGEFKLYTEKQKDEIAELASSYNRMISEINHLLEEQIRSKVREQEISSLRIKAELRMLHQQINPHFLYNTLESVKFRAMQNDVDGINRIVLALAEMMRYSVRGGSQEVALSEELKQINHYYTIQKIRMREKLELEWDIQDEARDTKVLKFILQPLVENAIQHGIVQMHIGGKVHVRAKLESEHVRIEVYDNGIGMDDEELEALRASLMSEESGEGRTGGVGLKNVYQRLQLFYRGRASMDIESAMMKGTLVRIRIPLQHQ